MNSSHSPFGHEAVGDAERLEVHLVARRLVVEGECSRVSVVPDLDEPARELEHLHRSGLGKRGRRRVDVERVDRVVEEHVLDVHEQELLVLLLVVQTEPDERRQRRPRVGVAMIDQLLHRGIDVHAVPADFFDRRDGRASPVAIADDADRRLRSTS